MALTRRQFAPGAIASTMLTATGLADSPWTSLRPYDIPDRYPRRTGTTLRIDPLSSSSSATDRQDATFRITS